MDDPRDHDLRRRLNALLALARDNEEKHRRFNELELKLIATSSLRELGERLFGDLASSFLLDYVTLTLADADGEMARLCADCGITADEHPQLQFAPAPAALAPLDGPEPWLGAFTVREHAARFPELHRRPASVALLPLVRRGTLMGSLNLGSLDPHRYTKGGSTDFLARLAAIAAICVENCANHERLRQLGFSDALTGVNNRRYFEERLAEEHAAATRKPQPLACMFLDVDHFKRFNDTHGHPAGDLALRAVAQVVRAQLRRSDTLSRYGGEEFVVLMPGASTNQAKECAERIRQAVANHRLTLASGGAAQVTVSVGIAVLTPGKPPVAIAAAALVQAADRALYRAKEAGRNRVVVASSPDA